MARRESLQAKFLTWVEQAEVAQVELIMSLCTAKLKARKGSGGGKASTKGKKLRTDVPIESAHYDHGATV